MHFNAPTPAFSFAHVGPKEKAWQKENGRGDVSPSADGEEGYAPSTCATWRWGYKVLTHVALPLCATHFIFPHRSQTFRSERLRRSPRAGEAETGACIAVRASENSPSPHKKRKHDVRTSFRGYIYPLLGSFGGARGAFFKRPLEQSLVQQTRT